MLGRRVGSLPGYCYSSELARSRLRWTPQTLKDPLHNSLRSVVARARAVRYVVFLGNSGAIGCKKTPCGPSRSAYHSSARVMQRVLNLWLEDPEELVAGQRMGFQVDSAQERADLIAYLATLK